MLIGCLLVYMIPRFHKAQSVQSFSGVLTITDMELSPPEPDEQASIEWMRFEVELHWP